MRHTSARTYGGHSLDFRHSGESPALTVLDDLMVGARPALLL